MPKNAFALSAMLLLLPIGIITYQLVLQENEEQTASVATNIPVAEADVTNNATQKPDTPSKITVRNKIEKKMLTYHKGFFSLTPNFELTVNDQPVKQGQQLQIPVVDGKVNVSYAYDFMGHKKGKKSVVFQVPANNEPLDITFSWKQEPRVIMGNAKALEVKEIY